MFMIFSVQPCIEGSAETWNITTSSQTTTHPSNKRKRKKGEICFFFFFFIVADKCIDQLILHSQSSLKKRRKKKRREVTVQICIVSSFLHIYMTLPTVNMQISYCCGTAHKAVVRRTVLMGKVHR